MGLWKLPGEYSTDEDSAIELIARRVTAIGSLPNPTINVIGGRIMGRFWYNASYGDVR